MTIGLFAGFQTAIMPLILEGGRVLFTLSIISGACVIMKSQGAEGVKKIKMATIGYTILRCAFIYIEFIDNVISKINF